MADAEPDVGRIVREWVRDHGGDPDSREVPINVPKASRHDLAALFGQLDYRLGVELGVEQGKFTRVLLDSNPKGRVIAVDAWACYKGYRDHVDQEKVSSFYERTMQRVGPYGDRVRIMPGFSMDVVREIEPNSLDWVYIDANHGFDWVMQDVIEWSKRVRSGGIVSGHDFTKPWKGREVVQVATAVRTYAGIHGISPWYTIGYLPGVDGSSAGPCQSWFWVKP